MIPEINKEYDCFDDGKIRESRMYKVTVIEIIPFDKIDNETLIQWKNEAEQCNWLYSAETDFFVKAHNGDEIEVFVRTLDDGWFSIGFMNCGQLDVDGSLVSSLK